MSELEKTQNLVRQSVERVTRKALADYVLNTPLELDSINRISLIVDLENTFEVELDSADMPPETFNSIGSLSNFILTLR